MQDFTYETMGFLSFEDTKQNLRESGIDEHTIEYIDQIVKIHCIHAHHLGWKEGRDSTQKAYIKKMNLTTAST